MKANIGNAKSVIGSTVNFVMSNATYPKIRDYKGYIGIPSHSLIVVNPLIPGSKKNLDSDWCDLCVTDGDNGIKPIIPFTTVKEGPDSPFSVIPNDDSGERTLTFNVPFNTVDYNVFKIIEKDGVYVLSVNDEEDLKSKLDKFNEDIDAKQQILDDAADKYNTIAERYSALSEELKELADVDDIIPKIKNSTKEAQEWLDENADNVQQMQEKLDNLKDDVDNIINGQGALDNIQSALDAFDKGIADKFDDIANDAREKYHIDELEDYIEKYEDYSKKVPYLLENTKDELHTEYEALAKNLRDCVNDNLLPLVDAQLDNCISSNDKMADLIQGAVEKLFETDGCCCNTLSIVTDEQAKIYNDKLPLAINTSLINPNTGDHYTEDEVREHNDDPNKNTGALKAGDTINLCDSDILGDNENPDSSNPDYELNNTAIKTAIINAIVDNINNGHTPDSAKVAVLNAVDKALGGSGDANNDSTAKQNVKAAVNEMANNAAAVEVASASTNIINSITGSSINHYDKRFFKMAAGVCNDNPDHGEVKYLTFSDAFYTCLTQCADLAIDTLGETPIIGCVSTS